MQPQRKEKYNVLVTGGAGFLGKAIIRELLDPDSPVKAATIRIFDQVVPLQYNTDFRLEYIRGDINDAEALKSACEGIDLVIHSAAIVDWGVKSDEEVLAVNVTGTENVVNACRHNGVRYLVFTSSLVNMPGAGFMCGWATVNQNASTSMWATSRTPTCRNSLPGLSVR